MTIPRELAAIFFDAGNTLLHLDYEFICKVIAAHGRVVSPLEFRIAEYGARAAVDRELAPEVVAPESVEGLMWGEGERPPYFAVALHHLGIGGDTAMRIAEELRRYNQESCLWRIIAPDTEAVLERLSTKYRLAVVSNSDGRIEHDLRATPLGRFFEHIIDSQVVGVEKPDPQIFAIALERVGVPAAQTIHVGDIYGIDVVGARRAGIHPVLIDRLDRYPGNLDCERIREIGEVGRVLSDEF